jgi:hypothetical protein
VAQKTAASHAIFAMADAEYFCTLSVALKLSVILLMVDALLRTKTSSARLFDSSQTRCTRLPKTDWNASDTSHAFLYSGSICCAV